MHKNIIEMKIKEISISYSESVNTGNFESVKWNITKVAELQDGDNPDDVQTELVKQVHDYAQKLIKRSTALRVMTSMPTKKGKTHKVPIVEIEDLEKENRKHKQALNND